MGMKKSINRLLATVALPFVALYFTARPFSRRRSLLLDNLLVAAEKIEGDVTWE